MDEGTRAIIKEITREICDIQYDKIDKTIKEHGEYLDKKFDCLKGQIKKVDDKIETVKNTVNDIKANNCALCIAHVTEHKEREKKITRNVTIISTTIPTIISIGSWIKGLIISWMQKPHN